MRKPALAILCAFLISPLLSTEKRFFDHLKSGDQYYGRFDNSMALSEYSKAYSLAPTDLEVLIRMARVHNDIGRLLLWKSDSAEYWYTRAVEYAKEMIAAHPDRAESHFWMALTMGSLVPFRGAQEKLEIGKNVAAYAHQAIRLDSAQAQAYTILGIIYREGARLTWYERLVANVIFGGTLPGTFKESEEMFLQSIRLQPRNIYAFFELSRTYREMDQPEKALECLRKSMEFPPENLRERHQQETAARQFARLESEFSRETRVNVSGH